MSRIYLDNAATSWPKPDSVYAAVDRAMRELGAAAGRGAYAEAIEVDREIGAARRAVARLIGAADPRHIVFTLNGTDSLNQAIHGCLRPGDHVVSSATDHNSVLRPLRALEDAGQIQVTRVGCDPRGVLNAADFKAAIQPTTRLVVVTHASNVTGAIQPLEQICNLVDHKEAFVLVDAAQSLGHLPIDVASGIDLLAAPGHKGLLGPLGTGVLYVRPGMEDQLRPTRQGGTGSVSQSDQQPDSWPDRFESGNLNVPGILGLGAGAEGLLAQGLEALRRHEVEMTEQLLAGLAELEGVSLYGPADAHRQVGVVSFNVHDYDPQEVAAMLDANYRVQARAGLQCAPGMHESLGTLPSGGTVRLSSGPFVTAEQIETALKAVRALAAAGSMTA